MTEVMPRYEAGCARNLVKGVTRYIFLYRDEGKGEIFLAIVSHLYYAICYNGYIQLNI
jgi:hypothetical protein